VLLATIERGILEKLSNYMYNCQPLDTNERNNMELVSFIELKGNKVDSLPVSFSASRYDMNQE